ncbi:Proteasome component ECM29 [Wickerhamiella sorbophila]|uniref:Proteasome component ECM29 n=1 Tax=Wickerhamiella sorbophila TaxID=45607 RepID=A0A2T0FJ75_9ASCO|nr:Proteasome component ECM29 [Wickerhamiella sorbophila]PRT55026.1 Proteasome component ECM29 [Wickerhamiella sorbophila]
MDELELISRVETRIVLASTDDKFSSTLDLYLSPLLQKLSSSREDSRRKVLSIVEHINTRLNPNVQLPVAKLLSLATSRGSESLLTKNVAANFLKKALENKSILPWIAPLGKSLESVTTESLHRASLLFQLFLQGIVEWSKAEKPAPIDFEDSVPGIAKRFTDLFMVDLAFKTRQVAPGLNHNDFVFQLGPNAELSEATLSQSKIAVLKFIDGAEWPADLKYLPLFAASADRLSDVSSSATAQLRRLSVPLSRDISTKLQTLASGSGGGLSAKNALQIKVMEIFAKEPAFAPADLSGNFQRAFESGDPLFLHTAIRLIKSLAIENKVSPSPSSILSTHADAWIEHLRTYIMNTGWPVSHVSAPQSDSLRQRAYETIGLLQRFTEIRTLSIVRFLVESLERDATIYVPSIQQALGEIMTQISSLTSELQAELKSILLSTLRSASRDVTKYVAVRFAIMGFPFEDSEARVLCLLGQDPANRSDVQEEARRGLHPYLYEKTTSMYLESVDVKFPDFEALLLTIDNANLQEFAPQVFDKAILLLSQILINSASPIRVDAEWTKVVDAAPIYDLKVRKAVASFLNSKPSASKLFDYCFAALSSGLEAYQHAPKVWSMLMKVSPQQLLTSQAERLENMLPLLEGRFKDVIADGISRICPASSASELARKLLPLSKGRASALASLLEKVSLDGLEVPKDLVSSLISYCKEEQYVGPLFNLACGGLLAHSDELLEFLKSKGDEKSMLVLGAYRLSNPDQAKLYMDTLISLNKSSNIDTLLANGESLSICASGWNSSALENYSSPEKLYQTSLVPELLEDIFAGSKKTDPAVRRSSCVRLLCLVQFSSHETKQYVSEVQKYFLRFLSDGDDVSQEAASRGLGIVYEQSDEETKRNLVEKLVGSFTSDRASQRAMAGTISEDTQLFEPGVLSTGDGSISTYKDVLNLASEVGDSTLVYKFMSLAASSKIWSSRRGMAFGLESIMAKADFDAASPTKKKLVPKLYRYIFDPNTKAREAMQSIWNVLVPDRRKTILEYFDDIIKELLSGSSAREWRVREASTRGLTSLVETLEWRHLEPRAIELWQVAFRMLDDIKDSVRKAGLDFTKSLASVLTRRLQSHSETNSNLLSTLIPFLTGPRGLQSESEDVRVFAMETLNKIAKSDSDDFKPFKLKFVNDFTLLLSTIEPQAMNYLALNAANYGVDASTIDESRMRGLSRSPIMETLESLVDRLDDSELRDYLADLPKTIKGSVGLPSKLASARLVISVCLRFFRDIDPTPVLRACASQFHDRNDLVAQTFAAAAGYVCRLTPLAEVLKYLDLLKTSYFSEDATDRERLIVAVAVSAISKHASDVFANSAALGLPLAFVGANDPDKNVSKVFEEVWASNTGGQGSIQLYSKEIMELSAPHLVSTLWHIREGAARSIGKTAEFLKEPNEAILDSLLKAMSGRSWPGKEYVFKALVKVSLLGSGDIDTVSNRVLNEIQRRNIQYRLKILPYVGEFLAKYPGSSVYAGFSSALLPFFETKAERPATVTEDEDEDAVSATDEEKIDILASAVESYNSGYEVEGWLEGLLLSSLASWKFKVAVCQHMVELSKKDYFSQNLWDRCADACATDYTHESVRIEWVRAAGALVDFGVSDDVRRRMLNEPSSVVITELKKYNFV